MFNLKTTSRIAMLLAAAATGIGLVSAAQAQTYSTYPAPQTYTVPQSPYGQPIVLMSQSQLETLTGSIALYPDALIAQILPAATYPVDVVQAARFVRAGVPAYQIDQYDLDPSVKAIAHYPTIIEMMDQNLAWTEQLGQAFIAQPGDVMQAIQSLRCRAQAAGTLCSTPQQLVYVESSCVRIVPANPAVIYVPSYDPTVCFQTTRVYRSSPVVSFSIGYDCGSWFNLDIDWVNRSCYNPGWTWNHWNDHFTVGHNHTIRPRFDYSPFRSGSAIWRRDSNRPTHFSQRDDHRGHADHSRDWDRNDNNRGPSRDRSDNNNRTRDGSRDWNQRRSDARPTTPAAPGRPSAPASPPRSDRPVQPSPRPAAPAINPAPDGPRWIDRGQWEAAKAAEAAKNASKNQPSATPRWTDRAQQRSAAPSAAPVPPQSSRQTEVARVPRAASSATAKATAPAPDGPRRLTAAAPTQPAAAAPNKADDRRSPTSDRGRDKQDKRDK